MTNFLSFLLIFILFYLASQGIISSLSLSF